jgi:hypothetical protein
VDLELGDEPGRYITKSSSPMNGRAIFTAWARPSGASWGR